jgi:hypothetical protein
MTTHKYDNPTLNNVQFLFAVMHDPLVSLDQRVRAAECLIKLGYGDLPAKREPAVVYRFADYQPVEADDDSTTRAASWSRRRMLVPSPPRIGIYR